MSWGQRLYSWIGRTFRLSDGEVWRQATGGSATGLSISTDTALGISTWWACVRLLADVISTLPLGIYERLENGGSRRAEEHPLWWILHDQPNFRQTSSQWRSNMIVNLCGWGNHFSMIGRTEPVEAGIRSQVTSIYPLYPERMSLEVDETPGNPIAMVKHTYSMPRGGPLPLKTDEILHVPLFGDGLLGYSPVAYARQSLELTQATEKFGSRFFGNAARPGGFLETEQKLSPEQRKLARENFESLHSGLDSVGKLALLEFGFKYKPAALPNDEAQFLETRRFQVAEVCKWHLVPVSAITESDKSSYLSNEANLLALAKFTLLPYLVRIEQAMDISLLRVDERRRYFIKHNLDALLRADTATRSQYFATSVQNGWMTRNEVRSKEEMNRSDQPGMDDYTAQTNLTPVGDLQKVGTAKALPIRQ